MDFYGLDIPDEQMEVPETLFTIILSIFQQMLYA